MPKLKYKSAPEEQNLILNLWNLFNPLKQSCDEFIRIKKILQELYGFIIDNLNPLGVFRGESNEDFRKLYGYLSYRGVLPESYLLRARGVMLHTVDNANFPVGSQQDEWSLDPADSKPYAGEIGLRLARAIEEKEQSRDGIELFVLDKGPGIRNCNDECGILELMGGGAIKSNPYHPYWGRDHEGLGLSLNWSDVHEIETMGKRWEKSHPEILIDVPFVQGVKVRTVNYGPTV